jgi:Uma2 family endonuclease
MSTVAHFSLEQYEHMVEVGAFSGADEKRLELLRGEIREMSPIGFIHSQVVTLLTDWSYEVVPRERMVIRVQNPIRVLGSDSEPQPDLVWAQRRAAADHHPAPGDVLLLVEVADTSLQDDRGEKLEIYAEAGIADYWIVNLIGQQIEVYRNPSGRTFQEQSIYRGDAEIHPLALPMAALRPSRLFD